MNKYLKETILWVIMLLPFVYLANVWNILPEQVPTHFNMDGNADDWSSKTALIYIIGGLVFGNYILMLVVPIIDPKKKIQQMGEKYFTFRLMLAVFMSLLAIFIVYSGNDGSIKHPNFLFALIGVLFTMLGNYFQTVRPNYFIGIRTPWTLESENVWKSTHRLGGKLWMVGGIMIAVLAFIISNNHIYSMVFGVIIFVMAAVPLVHSYLAYKKEKSSLKK